MYKKTPEGVFSRMFLDVITVDTLVASIFFAGSKAVRSGSKATGAGGKAVLHTFYTFLSFEAL